MIWKRIAELLPSLLLPEPTIVFWNNAGMPHWFTVACIFGISSVLIATGYFKIIDPLKNWLIEKLTKRGVLKKEFMERVQRWWGNANNLQNGFAKNWREAFLRRYGGENGVIIFLTSVPMVPFFPTFVLVAMKLAKVKNGFFILLLGN